MYNSPNSFLLQGFWRCISYWPKGQAAISGAAAINFCAQAAEIVRVASFPSTRNGRLRHFRQKKRNGLGIFYSKSGLAPQMASGWVQRLPRWLPGGF